MERYFIIVVQEFEDLLHLGSLVAEFALIRDYQKLALNSGKSCNAANLPQNPPSVDWAVCVGKTQTIFRGSGAEQCSQLLSDNPHNEISPEVWDLKSFNLLSNRVIDIMLDGWADCPDFWKSFNPSNCVRILRQRDQQSLNHQLYWRGTLKMRDPQNPSNFGQLEHAELSYGFDQLDLLTSQLRDESPHLVPSQRKTFCPFLELVAAYNTHSIPFIFYTSTSLTLTVQAADSFWEALDENVSFLFRLDYASDEVEHWEKEMGTQSIHFLSHWTEGQLRLLVLKSSDRVQNLANVFVRSMVSFPAILETPASKVFDLPVSVPYLRLDRMEKEIRRLQLLALHTWLEENGSIDPSTMDQLLDEVALAVARDERHRFIVDRPPDRVESNELVEGDLLKWKLEKKKEDAERLAVNNRLLTSNGRSVTVDVSHLLRCFGKKPPTRSPRKARTDSRSDQPVSTALKPSCDLQTARTTEWPQCAVLKYHGINYNLDADDEKAEKMRSEYQDKWVSMEASWSSWCNPWSVNSSTTYQLSNGKTRQSVANSSAAAAANSTAVPEVRTPRKNSQQQQAMRDLSQLRKSPRLLAKTSSSRPATRRTPSKKPSSATSNGPVPNNKDSFKQQLKAVIIKVLADQNIGTKDPLFRTCANKLSVICMALLKDSKTVVSQRQMYQVAKSQAKQVLQFVKP